MSWKKVNLSELAKPKEKGIKGGPFGSKLTTKDYVDDGIPVIRGSNLNGGKYLDESEFVYVTESKFHEDLSSNVANRGDLLFTQRGTLGQVAIIPETSQHKKYVISQSQMKMKVDEDLANPSFIYYYFSSKKAVKKIENLTISSGVPHINLGLLRSFELNLPSLQEQNEIVSILSAYDKLIQNSKRRIELLEKAARLLYKEWFVHLRFPGHEHTKIVDGVPEGWELIKIEDAVERVSVGNRYSKKTVFEKGSIPVLDQGKEGRIGFHNNEPSVEATPDDPVIVFANHTCYQRLIMYPFSAIQNVLPFKPNESLNRNIFWLHHATIGAVPQHGYKGHWPEFELKKVLKPSKQICQMFGNQVKKIELQKYKLSLQNDKLELARNILLPKLMNGDIPV